MSNTKSLLLAATMVSLMAVPVLAADVTADAELSAAPEDMTLIKMMESSAFTGNEVRTKDQVVIGLVDGVFESSAGYPVVLITISADIASKSSVKTFTVPLTKDDVADGSLTLGWTEAELFVALDSNLQPFKP